MTRHTFRRAFLALTLVAASCGYGPYPIPTLSPPTEVSELDGLVQISYAPFPPSPFFSERVIVAEVRAEEMDGRGTTRGTIEALPEGDGRLLVRITLTETEDTIDGETETGTPESGEEVVYEFRLTPDGRASGHSLRMPGVSLDSPRYARQRERLAHTAARLFPPLPQDGFAQGSPYFDLAEMGSLSGLRHTMRAESFEGQLRVIGEGVYEGRRVLVVAGDVSLVTPYENAVRTTVEGPYFQLVDVATGVALLSSLDAAMNLSVALEAGRAQMTMTTRIDLPPTAAGGPAAGLPRR